MIYLQLNHLTVFSGGKEDSDIPNWGVLCSVLLALCDVFLLVAVVFYCQLALRCIIPVVSLLPNSVKREALILDMTDV